MAFQRSLLHWYRCHQRDLPWRNTQDPYAILVSEFMLQQTRVETVIPYFERFLQLFPTLSTLAKTSLPKVLKAWAGLGYYARARHLHQAAKRIWFDWNGQIPSKKKDLLTLPGFGPYTAGAVASIAFNEPVAALDGNMIRISRRIQGFKGKRISAQSIKSMEEFLETLIPRGRASDFNQALMDLGALICLPPQPRCPECPLKRFCASQGMKSQKTRKKKNIRKEVWAVAVVGEHGRFFFHQKEGQGLLGGLWQFPTITLLHNNGRTGKRNRTEELDELQMMLKQDFGLRINKITPLPPVVHQFTHIHVTMKPYFCSVVNKPKNQNSRGIRWIQPVNLFRYPVSTAMRKIISLIPLPLE